MKKLFILSLLGLFFGLSQVQAQTYPGDKYESKNFYGNGITEYLLVKYSNNKKQVFYYNSARPKPIKLIVISDKDFFSKKGSCGANNTKVRFPNDHKVYEIKSAPGEMYCVHPNGKRQDYKPVNNY
ncbi:MAG TPA: hypothetical protein DCS93_44710 [Microscillaceae bacterium]|nr:hypothetical protein [Microscillaceae bacterium]